MSAVEHKQGDDGKGHVVALPSVPVSRSHMRNMVDAVKRTYRGDCNVTDGLMDVGILAGILFLKGWMMQVAWNSCMPYTTRKDMKMFRKINYSTALALVLMYEVLIL